MARRLLFSLTKKDFTVTHIRGSGPGGQHRNKKHTGVRIVHCASGAEGVATDSKIQKDNRRNAFQRLIASPRFQTWHRIEVAKRLADESQIQRQVAAMMKPENLRIETGDHFDG